jgi:hypothetical protein
MGLRDDTSLAACNSETSTLGGDSHSGELSADQPEEPVPVPGRFLVSLKAAYVHFLVQSICTFELRQMRNNVEEKRL